MKRICFLAVLVFSIYSTNSNAQTLGKLYGLLSRGGDSTGGVMFNYDAQHSKNTVVKSFYPGIMGVAYNNLVQATDGDFYGMTEGGGADGVGTIFKCSASGKVTLLHTFTDYPDGAYAFASLIQANDGNLYGMTEGGGANGYGCIFKCTTTGTFSIIYSFNTGITGANPYGSLIQATDGKLYGMTSAGGTSNNGNVFSCTLAGVYTDLADFNSTNGNTPYGNLIQAKNGNLYGMTKNGGVNNLGVIFQCTTTGTLTKLVDFTGTTNGSTPYGSLVQAADNNLYGMTSAGGANSYGVIFQCTTSGTLTKLVDFDYTTNGATPYGNLMQATDGNLYGMASTGGTYGSGILFQCTTIGTLTPVVNYSNYESPYGSLIQATDGNLYGMTVSGGTAESGTIFKCTTGGTNVVLYNMGVNTFGSTPNGSPNQGSDGSIYGMTSQGGSIGYGTIFKTDTLGVTKVIFNFDSTNGSNPYGSLIMAKDGFLYGMTDRGGATNVGVIFKCSSAGVLTKLVDFNITNGETPFGHLIEGTDGNLYGMTENGGIIGYGVIFKCTTAGVITVLYNFDGTNGGQYPYGSFKGFGVMYFNLSYYFIRFTIEAAFTDILHIKMLYTYLSLIDLYRGICTRLYRV